MTIEERNMNLDLFVTVMSDVNSNLGCKFDKKCPFDEKKMTLGYIALRYCSVKKKLSLLYQFSNGISFSHIASF